MLAAFLALSLGSVVGSPHPDREWECVRNRPCNIRLDAGNVTSDDLVLVLDEDRDSCPVCRRSSYGLCPWLSQDTGQDRTVSGPFRQPNAVLHIPFLVAFEVLKPQPR